MGVAAASEGVVMILLQRDLKIEILPEVWSQGRAVLVQGLAKEGRVPPEEIDRALRCKSAFAQTPDNHTHEVIP